MTEFSVSKKSHLEVGNAGDGRGDGPMDVVMEMGPAATSIAVETARGTIFELRKRNENRQPRKRGLSQVAPSERRSNMEMTTRQQA